MKLKPPDSSRQPKRLGRTSTIEAPPLDTFKQINLNAAGMDIGDRSIDVCVPPGRDKPSVRGFSTFTADLHALADWFSQCGVKTVAMASTGVDWIPIFQILEARGFEVYLGNAAHIKHVPGKKTDILDCQWIQQLQTDGLLQASFRPDELTCVLRSFVRHRDRLMRTRASHLQPIQKALQPMNLKLTNVLKDITGQTGMSMLRDILAGVHDPPKLARHRPPCCAKSEAEIAKSLEGDDRPEHLFALRQAVELLDVYPEKLSSDCLSQAQASSAVCRRFPSSG